MANNTPSFRYPFTLPKDTHPQVANALRSAYNSLSDLNQAIEALNTKVAALQTPTAVATALALAVNGIPNSDQERLNLQSADGSVTLTDLGGGNINAAAGIAQPPSLFPTGVYLATDNGGAQTSSGFYLTSFTPGSLTLSIGTVPTNTVPGFQNAKVGNSLAGNGGQYNTSTSYYASVGMIGRIRTKLRLTQTTNVRVWIALVEASTVMITNSPNTNVVGFRYSTPAGDTNWMCVTQTSTIASTIATATGSFLDSSTFHIFETQYDGTTVTFLIDDTVVGTSTTNIPTSGRLMFYIAIDNAGIAGQPAFDLAWVVVEARL